MAERFIDDRILTGTAEDPQLIGGKCQSCDLVSFPAARGCARCGGAQIEQTSLATRGTIWTWTTQGFLPKRPYTGPETAETFEPFVIGYIDLPDGLRVESRILATPDEVHIGQEVELVTAPHLDKDGGEVLTFAFQPLLATEGAS